MLSVSGRDSQCLEDLTICNLTELPLPARNLLREADLCKFLEGTEAEVNRQIVRSTVYLSKCTRPDIAYPLGQLARFMSKPGQIHLRMASQLLQYRGTRNLVSQYRGLKYKEGQYIAWIDATWATEDDRKSFQGYTINCFGRAVIWNSTRQKSTALLSMEAEIVATSEGAREIAWMENVSSDLGIIIWNRLFFMIDNKPMVEVTKDASFQRKVKHIETR